MAETLDGQGISLNLTATINNPKAQQSVVAAMNIAKTIGMTSGTGLLQADRLFADTRTIAISGTDSLDLAGVLIDAVGTLLTFARVKFLYVAASAANTNNVVIGNGTNPFINWITPSTGAIPVRPGGFLALLATDATAYPVTPATGDILLATNSGAGTTVTYDVVIIGSSV